MNVKRHIPNLLTLGNLLCGTIATILAIKGDFVGTAILVATGIGFDFFDGFVARMLNVQGELGKQLDSLADMVTSVDNNQYNILRLMTCLFCVVIVILIISIIVLNEIWAIGTILHKYDY